MVVKKYCDEKGYFYHRHNIKTTINCQGLKKKPETLVTLKSVNNWQSVKNLIKLWDELKRKEITITIKANWGQKSKWDCITENKVSEKEEKKKKKKKKKNKPKCHRFTMRSMLNW